MQQVEVNLDLWPRQFEAFESPAREILFGGASEGGKSHFVRVMLIALCLDVPELQCVLIRKKHDDILKNHVEGPGGFRALLKDLVKAKQVKITDYEVRFSNGSIIAFQHCQDERQFTSAQGVEKHVLVIDEATQIPESLINMFRAWVRMPAQMRERLPERWRKKLPLILYTANPIGVSVGFFRRNFVKARPPFTIETIHGFPRQYIPSKAEDNASADLEALTGRLEALNDPGLARALREGDWDAPVGDFIRQWDDQIHRVADFLPPEHWFKFRTFDWGGAEPAVIYWWAVSDGVRFEDHEERERWFPRGALVGYREWYIADVANPAVGLDLPNEDIAKGIVERTIELTSGITITDSLPFQRRGSELMADMFAKHGVILTHGNTDRVNGWKRLKDMLVGQDGFPMLYFCYSCKYAADYIPALQRHPHKLEDAQEHGEATHACDAIRLAVMTRPPVVTATKKVAGIFKPSIISSTPRELLQQARKKAAAGGRRS